MLIENMQATNKNIPATCILFFKTANCSKCIEQYGILTSEEFEYDIIVLDENNGYELGTFFSVYATPVLIYIKDKEEQFRTYGVKTIEEIERKLSDF